MRNFPSIALSLLLAASAPAADTSTYTTVDLTRFINSSLDASVLYQGENHTNHLKDLPKGRADFKGVPFDVAGIVQLDSAILYTMGKKFPKKVEGIPVNQAIAKIYLLHGTAWRDHAGRKLASLVLHYDDKTSAKLDIQYGVHVMDWWALPEPKGMALMDENSIIAWTGTNPQAAAANTTLRLYRTSFANPKPEKKVSSIDYLSGASESAPFMLGLTLESSR